MRHAIFSLLLATCAWFAIPARGDTTPAVPHGDTARVVLRVIVNTVDQGDRFVSPNGPGDFGLAAAELRGLGLRLPLGSASDSAIVSLRSLAPGVRFLLDEASAALWLTVSPELLPKQEIALGTWSARPARPLHDDVAFLNYAISHVISDRGSFGSWSMPVETGLRSRGWLALSTFAGTASVGARSVVRLNSSLTRDDPRSMRRIVIGDAAARSGALGSSTVLGGVRIASEFALARDLEITPQHEIEGLLETPSDVELRVNGVLVRRDHLPPGGFRYTDLPMVSGAGEVTLSVRDAFGTVHTIASPHYHSRSLLRPGLADYGWSLGFERRSLGLRSFDYGRPMLLGTHRVGLSPTTTAGIGVEASAGRAKLSPTVTRTVGSFAEVQGTLAASRDERGNGAAWRATGLASLRRAEVDFSVEGASPGFSGHAAGRGLATPRLAVALGASWSNRALGSLSVRASRAESHEGLVDERASASWSRRLARQLSMITRVQRVRGARSDVESSVMFSRLGPSRSAGVNAQHSSEGTRVTFHLQQSAPPGPGFEHRLQIEGSMGPDARPLHASTMATRYQGGRGQWGLTRRQHGARGSWDLNASGSIVRVGGAFFLGRPVRDGFAVVRVRGMRGVPVLVRRQNLGVTDGRGALLVPSLTSHDANSIGLDDRALPAEWNLVQREQFVSPPFRGGGIVEFEARRFQSLEGRVVMVRDGVATPAEYAGFEVEVGASTIRTTVGRQGLCYLENVPAGEYRARVFLGDEECRFLLRVPRSDATTVDLGEIRCVVSR